MTLLFDFPEDGLTSVRVCPCARSVQTLTWTLWEGFLASKRCEERLGTGRQGERSSDDLGLKSSKDQSGCPPALAGSLHLWK